MDRNQLTYDIGQLLPAILNTELNPVSDEEIQSRLEEFIQKYHICVI